MKKSSNRVSKRIGGPFLAAAFFCESMMEDSSGKVSAIGILDTVTIYIAHDAPKNVPSEDTPLPLTQSLLVFFRGGDSPGKHQLRLVLTRPDGKRGKPTDREVELSKSLQGGINVRTHMAMSITMTGVYWLDVILDGKLYTRVPLKVAVQRVPAPEGKK